MKKITFLLLALCITTITAFAQRRQTGNLTIFSEDGSKFYLELNGLRYNSVAQTNVRIEELPAPNYNCRIVFADSRKPIINKKNMAIANMEGIMQDVTYRIKKDRKGRRVLSVHSYIPARQNMVRPSNCAVYRCGMADDMIMAPDGTMYAQQVTVETITNDNFGINMGGIGVNVNVPGGSTTTTTTTTTTTSGTGYGNANSNNGYGQNGGYNNSNGNGNGQHSGYNQNNTGGYNNQDGNNSGYHNNGNNDGVCRVAMNNADFEAAKNAIKDNHFDDTRISTAKEIMAHNCVLATQVLAFVQLITFEGDRMELAKYAYNYCIDKNNYYKVNSAFTFESSKTELNDYVRTQR